MLFSGTDLKREQCLTESNKASIIHLFMAHDLEQIHVFKVEKMLTTTNVSMLKPKMFLFTAGAFKDTFS